MAIFNIKLCFMVFTERAYPIFEQVIKDYHVHDNKTNLILNFFYF